MTIDDDGAFLIHSESLLSAIDVTVTYPNTVANKVYRLTPGKKQHQLVLVPGTTLKGRVLAAAPAAGVNVRLSGLGGGTTQVEFAGTYDAVTDESGRFTFSQVYPLREFRLFTRMSDGGVPSGVAIPQSVFSGGTGQTIELGELNLHPTHRVARTRAVGRAKPPAAANVRAARAAGRPRYARKRG